MAPTRKRLGGSDPWDLPHHSESQAAHPARWQRFAVCPRKHISSHVPCIPGAFIRLSLSPLYTLSLSLSLSHTHTHTHTHGHTHPQSQQLSLLHGSDGKESACQCGRPGFDSLGRKDPLEEGSGNLTPEFSPGESHGQRSLAGLQCMGSQTWKGLRD